MATIVIHTNLSLDGVVEDPDGKEGSSGGGWFARSGADLGAWTELEAQELQTADALLLGRRSEEWFADRWPGRAGAFADRMNGIPKFVVSSSAAKARWSNATVLAGDAVASVAGLKEELPGTVFVYGSYQLGQALLEHGLVDELRLVVFPVVVGSGARLFGPTSSPRPLRQTGSRSFGDGLTFLTYQVVRSL